MHILILKAKAAALGITVAELIRRQARKPSAYVAVCEDEQGCLHIKPRVHARRQIGRVIYWTGNGRASEEVLT